MKNINIVVTGGAGYKGIKLVTKLLDRGHRVTILDNFMYGYNSVLHLVSHPNLTILSMDIRNLTHDSLKGFDVIYHLAGISGMPACAANPNSAEMINIDASRRLVTSLSEDQLLIYASTTSFYGANGSDCDEATTVHPVSIYGRTKYEAERIIMQRSNSIALRFATVFGLSPKMRDDLMVNDFCYKAVHDRSVVLFVAQSKRTFVHIDDAINGYLFALDHAKNMCGGIYNVGDESLNYSKWEIAQAIQKYIKYEIIDSSLPDLDTRNFQVSFKKMRELGFHAAKTLDEGVHELVKLYKFYSIYSPYRVI
jgi:nucleoside-diphosphate-sugar epimerase